MSEPEKSLQDFLQRWSRRKLSSEQRGAAEPVPAAPRTNAEQTDAGDDAADESSAAPPFDPAILPPIESINAQTDLRPFLAPGVPEDITRAALRRAWVSDPAIRDFIGIAENQWDFTKLDGVPGFGALELTPALRRMALGILGGKPDDDATSAEVDEAAEKSGKTAPPDPAAVAVPAAVEESLVAASPVPARLVPASPVAAESIQAAVERDEAIPVDSLSAEFGPVPQVRKHGGALPR
jgi:hypothetical protein